MTPLSTCSNCTQIIDRDNYLPKNAAFYLLGSITISFLAGGRAQI
jgi:hypothetical protein